VRRYIEEAWDETDDDSDADDEPTRAGHRPLERGERPPYDADAT
jgi:hypothetical protein